MKQVFNYFCISVKKHATLTILFCIAFVLAVVLGLFIGLPKPLNDMYNDYVLQFFNNVLAKDSSIIKFYFRRLLSLILLYIPIVLLTLNDVTFYGVFLIVFYKGYVLGVMLKTVFLFLNFFGGIVFVFTLFIESVIVAISIILFAVICYKQNANKTHCFYQKLIKKTALCLAIGSLGIEIQILLIICVFRPINFYF